MENARRIEPNLATRNPSLRPRLIAFALDYLVIAAYAIVLASATLLLAASPARSRLAKLVATPASMNAVAFVTLVLPVTLYFALQEGSARQGTWGKRKVGLRVTATGGGQLPAGRALLRSTIKFLPWQIAHTCLFGVPGWPLAPAQPPGWVIAGFGFVWVLVIAYIATLGLSPSHRTLYDRLAGSEVRKVEG